MTIRQLFYRLVSSGLVDKTEGEYRSTVGRLAIEMRQAGMIPFDWIADNTRWMRKPRTYPSLKAMLQNTAEIYRRDLWQKQPVYVELWLEKDALAGVLYEVTEQWDVPLMVTRGYPSLSFVHSAAEAIDEQQKPCYLYYFGDYDPSGLDIPRVTEQRLREFAPDADIHFERVAVTPEQIRDWNLPTRPTKRTDPRARGFAGMSVELDAIHPRDLRALAKSCVTDHIDRRALKRMLRVEAAERESLELFAKNWKGNGRKA